MKQYSIHFQKNSKQNSPESCITIFSCTKSNLLYFNMQESIQIHINSYEKNLGFVYG